MSDDTRFLTIPRNNPINAFTVGGIVKDAGLTLEKFRKLLLFFGEMFDDRRHTPAVIGAPVSVFIRVSKTGIRSFCSQRSCKGPTIGFGGRLSAQVC
jgi:hypothetical protein